MAGNDYGKREHMNTAAWIAPKAAHKAMMNRLLALNCHVIFCLRGEPKIAMEKNDKGKIVPVDKGFQPICEKSFMFDMTVSFSSGRSARRRRADQALVARGSRAAVRPEPAVR